LGRRGSSTLGGVGEGKKGSPAPTLSGGGKSVVRGRKKRGGGAFLSFFFGGRGGGEEKKCSFFSSSRGERRFIGKEGGEKRDGLSATMLGVLAVSIEGRTGPGGGKGGGRRNILAIVNLS